uniref:Transporter n=1 Tax=Strigamia maritima TaxID=126957 RepID=T1JCL7_STRMM
MTILIYLLYQFQLQEYSESSEDDVRDRDNWTRPMEFLLSCIASSVGLGNVWRFPFTAYENGGGAFLIPYLIVLFLIGRPLYFMELALGQFCSYGSVKAWHCVPLLKGIGIGQALSSFYVMTYYVVLAAVCFFYLIASMQKILPWTYCDPEWADHKCFDCGANCSVRRKIINCFNASRWSNESRQSSVEQYNQNYVLKMSDGLDHMGTVDWRLALCLLLCWIVLFLSAIKGVKSSGKTAYFTALFPYVVLITLFVVGVRLDGAVDGILYFITPRWEKLLDIMVWYKACEQMFFSLTVGYGVLIVYSSYNRFDHKIYRDAVIISVLDTFTSMLAGVTIFSVIGALAYELKVPIDKVIKTETSLAFVAYPEALSRIDVVPQLWAVMFFLMMVTLALGTTIADICCVMTVLQDQLPRVSRVKLLSLLCIVAYCMGLTYVTSGGQYVLKLIDNLGAGFSSFVFAIGEAVGLMWIYGMQKFAADISFMLGFKIGTYWKVTWAVFCPIILTVILIYSLVSFEPLELAGYVYPGWAEAIGWSLAAVALGQIPIWAIVTVWKQPGNNLLEKFRNSMQSSSEWGPRDSSDKKRWENATRGYDTRRCLCYYNIAKPEPA